MGFIFFKKSKMRYAIEHCDIKEMKRLLDGGVDPDMRDDYGRSFLYYAVSLGNRDAVELLIERGAVVDSNSYFKGSLIHVAADRGNLEIAQLLLDKNPDLVKIKNHHGDTALHYAARKGYADVAELLIERGIDPLTKNFENRTALFFAEKERHPAVVALLLPHQPAPKAQPAAPAAAKEEPRYVPPVYNGWRKMADDKVAHVSTEYAIGYRLTEIFNFKTRERTRLYQNLDTKSEASETVSFDKVTEKNVLEDARAQLVKMGGKVSPDAVGGIVKKPGLK